MKKLFYLWTAGIMLLAFSCKHDDPDDVYKTYPLAVELVYPATGASAKDRKSVV